MILSETWSQQWFGDEYMPKSIITVQLDSRISNELKQQLTKIGLSINDYFTLAAQQFLIQGKVPFEIQSDTDIRKERFNLETRQTIIRALAEEEGIIKNTAKTFDNVDDAMTELFGQQ